RPSERLRPRGRFGGDARTGARARRYHRRSFRRHGDYDFRESPASAEIAMPALRILIADDHPAVRRSVRSLIESQDDWIVCAEAVRPPDPVPLAGSFLREHRHVAAFFASAEERYNVLAPFINVGLGRGEKAIHLIDPPDRDRHMKQLEQHGVAAGAAEARSQL